MQAHYFRAQGPDCADFFHRITTANIHALDFGPGKSSPWQAACILSPQGKFRAYFHLKRESQDCFLFEVGVSPGSPNSPTPADTWKKSFQDTIEQFTFAEKIEWTELTSEQIAQEKIQSSSDLNLSIDQRIESMRAGLDTEITTDLTPLDVGLRSAIADNKGCYPGQEVIEKIISLGSPPKRLALLKAKSAALKLERENALPAKLLDLESGAEAGMLTSLSLDGKSALAVLKKTKTALGLEFKVDAPSDSGGSEVIFTLHALAP